MFDHSEFLSQRLMKNYFDRQIGTRLKPLGISASSARFLMAMSGSTGMSLKEVGVALTVDKSMVSRISKQLSKMELIVNKSNSPKVYKLLLTKKGIETEAKVRIMMHEERESLMSCLTEEELAVIYSAGLKIKKKVAEEMEMPQYKMVLE